MAYTDDAVRSKLSLLNETQDSIVTVAQWIMFHRRQADRTAELWLAKLRDSPVPKRLNLIYLANEVVQQSRARSKNDFLLAFEPLISDATSTAYKGASVETQNKIRRVVEVWRQRNIFDPNIQSTTEKRLAEIDQLRGGANGLGKPKLGGSLLSAGAVPSELDALSKAIGGLSKVEATAKLAANAEGEYDTMMSPEAETPSPPVHAARLNSLLKNLATAQSAVQGCIKARQEIVAELEKLMQTHRAKLNDEETRAEDISSKVTTVEAKKKSVEDHIMQGLSSLDTAPAVENDETRPEPESFTPPPPEVEAFTPPADDTDTFAIGDANPDEALVASTTGADFIQEQPTNFTEPAPSFEPETVLQGQTRQASSELQSDPRLKRRKVSHSQSTDVDDAIFNSGDLGVDEEGVSALLGN